MQFMMYRSNQLGCITNNKFQYMMRHVSPNGLRKKEPDDTPFFLSENVFQGAISLLKDENVLTVSKILQLFANYGASLYPDEIEVLLHLKKDTLREKMYDLRLSI